MVGRRRSVISTDDVELGLNLGRAPEELREACCKCRSENKSSDIECSLPPEICAYPLGITGDDDSANRRADHSGAEAK